MTDDHNVERLRTQKQNRSYWKWLTMLADELNASGQSMGDGVLIRIPLYYSAPALHERVVKPYMNAHLPDRDSTTKLTTIEMQQLYEQLNEIIGRRSGVSIPWPDEYSQSLE